MQGPLASLAYRVAQRERFLIKSSGSLNGFLEGVACAEGGNLLGRILIFSPVWGFLPSRAFCSLKNVACIVVSDCSL
jgi:hypothetical protein